MPDVIRVSFWEKDFTETDARTSLIWWMIKGGRVGKKNRIKHVPTPSLPSQIGDQSGRGTKDVRTPQPGDPSLGQLNLTFIPGRPTCSFTIGRIKVKSGLEEEWYQMTILRPGWDWIVDTTNILHKIQATLSISSGTKHWKGKVSSGEGGRSGSSKKMNKKSYLHKYGWGPVPEGRESKVVAASSTFCLHLDLQYKFNEERSCCFKC